MMHTADPDSRIVEMHLVEVSSQGAMDTSLSLLSEQPDLWTWDWIITVDKVLEGTSIEGVSRLADGYADLPKTDAITVVVSGDRDLVFWTDVIQFQYPGRRRHIVPDRASALALIRERRAMPT